MKSQAVFSIAAVIALVVAAANAEEKAGSNDNMPPPGFTALFNGKDLINSTAHLDPNRQDFVDFPLQH